ncbi:MAG TPA: flavin reductase family protein [Gaiellaceae bacterium]|nr:flavin reductase family protein [Gaiellaceae bacterium]
MVSGDELRDVMRSFPSGICVVTIEFERHRTGLTVGSLASLSLEPPLVGFALGRQAQLHELLREAGEFGVSLLRGDQEAVAQHFARSVPPIALWTGVELRDLERPPLLRDALGWLRCRVSAEHPVGDHTLFVGEVVWAEVGSYDQALVYVRQGYGSV